MLDREPEYRRRIREKRVRRQLDANQQAQEASQNARISKVETSIKAIGEQIAAYADESSPTNKGKRCREWAEIFSLIGAAVVGLIAIGVSSWDADNQRTVMQRQLDEMRDEQRPWISIDHMDPASSLHRDQSGLLYLRVSFNLKNSGHTPARYTDVAATMVVRDNATADLSKIRTTCSKERTRPINENATGQPIFPGDTRFDTYGVALSKDEEAKLAGEGKSILLGGCIDYVYGLRNEHHQTSFVVEIDKPGPDNTFLYVDYGKDIPLAPASISFAYNPGLAANPD